MNGGQRALKAALVALVMAFALSLAAPAFAATPTQPVLRDVFVTPRASLATSPTVTVQWSASTDASGHALVYDVYRDVIPITGATIISRGLTPVGSGLTGTSAQINAASTETTQSYVWFYAVVARDSLGVKSAPSFNMSPNVHGNRSDPNQVSCPRCHRVHGAYQVNYRYKEACYYCHGSTGANFATGAKSTYNTEASFFDTGTVAAGSKHRNSYMTSQRRECTACHTPHRSPFFYDATGVYVASQSYRRMLRVEYATRTYEYYSRNDNPAGNTFCFSCHGSTSVTWNSKTINAQQAMGIAGGPDAYAATGGDHNYAGYATSAHGPSTVLPNTTDPNPGIQCLACHNKHASRADKLVDYRSLNTTASQTGGAEVCFACHSNSSTDTRIAGSTKPFAWNGRDVKAQFTDTSAYISRHPYQTVSGSWVTDTMTVLSHTAKAEFDTYSLVNAATTDSSGGEVQLAQYTTTIQIPVVFGMQGGTTTFDEYTPGSNAWNDVYNPNNSTLGWNPGSGSSSFVVNNRVYITRGGANSAQGYYDIATNSWAAGQTLPNTIGQGGDTAVNTRSDSTCVYYTRANNQAAIMWWDYTGTATGSFNFRTSGVDRNLGVGSAIAFAPTTNRLFVINRSGTTGDGRLYYRSSPGRATTSVDFTQALQVVTSSTTASRHSRMTYFVKNGIEYLMIVGRDTGDVRDTIIISNLSGTPTATNLDIDPFGADLGDGCDLEWDGGDYIYAIRGGGQTGFARIRIPDSPATKSSWGSWQSLANPPWGATWAAGSSIAPAAYSTTGLAYRSAGTATTPDITPDASVHHWGTVSWTEAEPSGTDLRVSVVAHTGSAWTTVAASVDDPPIDLTSHATSAYPRIRLVAELSTTDNQKTPVLHDWTVTGLYDRLVTPSGSLTCINCHNVHYVGKGASGVAWSMVRASDPDNTKLAAPTTPTTFCLRCHDGSTAPASTTTTTIVPYTAAFREVTSPFFPGWNKTASGVDFASSGHRATTIQGLVGQFGCETCHDPHASRNQRLTAITQRPDGSTSAGHLNVSRDNSTTWSEQALCYGCHDARRTGSCGCHNTDMSWLNASTAFSQTYRHPVERSGRHTDTETASQLGASNRHAECVDCHDPHAARRGRHTAYSSLAGEVLRGATGVKPKAWPGNWTAVSSSNWTTERLDGGSADHEAYLCFKCHSSYSGQPFTATRSNNATYTSTDQALEFNPSNFSYHNVLGQSVGMQSSFTFVDSSGATQNRTWSLPAASSFLKTEWVNNGGVHAKMTCTDCHAGSTTNARGPHGSSAQWLLDPGYTNWTNTTSLTSYSTVICGKCHTNLATSNNVHADHDNRGAQGGYCRFCHIKIPHGWKRPRMLGYTTDGAYATISGGITKIRANKNYTPNNWSKGSGGDCSAGCDTGTHPSTLTGATYWP